jgi:hypothetical protein
LLDLCGNKINWNIKLSISTNWCICDIIINDVCDMSNEIVNGVCDMSNEFYY